MSESALQTEWDRHVPTRAEWLRETAQFNRRYRQWCLDNGVPYFTFKDAVNASGREAKKRKIRAQQELSAEPCND